MTLEVGRRWVNGRWTTDIENETGGGGGGPLPDPITETVNIKPASTGDTWVLSTMAPDGLTSSVAFGNAVWDDTDPNGCGEIGGQENGDLQMYCKYSGRQLRLGNNQGGVILRSVEPADAELAQRDLCIWFDATAGTVTFKARTLAGDVVSSAPIALT